MLKFHEDHPYASFGFIGANSDGESEDSTKRFRIYRMVMENFFSPIDFRHFAYEQKSAYIMLNRNNNEPDLMNKIQTMFQEIYLDLQ